MKKILFLAMVAAAMVSCSQNEEFENAGQKAEVKFGAIVKSSTRATIVKNAGFKEFTVYAFKTDAKMTTTPAPTRTAFMDGVTVTKNAETSKWGYTDGPYYWPASGYVQFFSVVPAPADGIIAGTGYPSFDYTVPVKDEQVDLLAANLVDKDKTAGDLQLPFNHLLTQVNFSIKGENGFTYTLTELELTGVKDKGTFTFDGNATAGGWSAQDVSANPSTVYKYTGSAKLESDGTNSTTLDKGDDALFMLLPQMIAQDAVIVKVTYSAQTTATPVQITADNVTKEVAIPAGTWEKGKSVRYILNLTSDASQVTFGEPIWDEWDAEPQGGDGEVTPVTPTPQP